MPLAQHPRLVEMDHLNSRSDSRVRTGSHADVAMSGIEEVDQPPPPIDERSGNGRAVFDVVDFFAGMGGLSIGFAGDGFNVRGFDMDPAAVATYQLNVSSAEEWDARDGYPDLSVDVVLGGPPCRPWSVVNLTKRGPAHRDFHLVHDLVQAIERYKPQVFAIENVPAVKGHLEGEITSLKEAGYSVEGRIVRYADWGAPSRRRRFFLVGVRSGSATTVWRSLEAMKTEQRTVQDAIGHLRDLERDAFADHEWGEFQTIQRYAAKYASGQYGWYRLRWDEPAPSFGNVAKTYILHPDHDRVLSVREAIAILGFSRDYRFPDRVSRTAKYRMAADAVSPTFSNALARAIRRHLEASHSALDTDRGLQLVAWGN